MGTKRRLAPDICRALDTCQPGPVLDAFAGMCSVGEHLPSPRQIWSNDLQCFSNEVANALFCSRELPLSPPSARMVLTPAFNDNFVRAAVRYEAKLAREAKALASYDHVPFCQQFDEAMAQTEFDVRTHEDGHDLFASRYGGLYFGVRQALEIDSLRHAIEFGFRNGEISHDDRRWLIVSLGIAMSKCTTSTGHFAQPLAPKASTVVRCVHQRRRSIYGETIEVLGGLAPKGSPTWRKRNKVFGSDATDLLARLSRTPDRPGVVYADPPYTADQYSRYYHLYETLVRYDYPPCVGRGRYRDDRAVSDFCLPTKVRGAFDRLVGGAKSLGADLVLSYPEKGLLPNSKEQLIAIFNAHYGRDPEVYEITHSHSTMGGSKGSAASSVVERLYRIAA